MHLRKDTQLHASFVGRFGSMRSATMADFANGELTVVIPVQYEATKSRPEVHGQARGRHRLQGTTRRRERDVRSRWTGKRAPAATPTKTVTWGASVPACSLPPGSTGGSSGAPPKGICWSVEGGVLTNKPPCADLITEKTFGDFKLHVELMYPAGSNSGIYLRGRYEVQIQDDAGKPVDSHRMGGIYGFLTPYVNAAKRGRRVAGVRHHARRASRDRRAERADHHRQRDHPGITGGAIDSDEGAPARSCCRATTGRFRSGTSP